MEACIAEAAEQWDAASGKSRGYGFLAFRDRHDAEQASEYRRKRYLPVPV